MEADCHETQGEEHLVNIKDYSQHEHSDEEDSPFDELEHILAQDDRQPHRHHEQNHQQRLTQRIQDLQNDCNALRDRNTRLAERANDLTTDLVSMEALASQDDEQAAAIEAVEMQLKELRNAVDDYRAKHTKATQERQAQLARLRQELERATADRNSLEEQRESLIEANEDLIRTNEGLNNEIERLQNELMQSRSQPQSSRSNRLQSRRDVGFESEVQAELEILIEKLMAELQLQRNQRRRLGDEVRRMQRETLTLEKEVAAKNQKIYELEMSVLKGTRANRTQNSQRNNERLRSRPEITGNGNGKSDRISNRNIPLSEFLSLQQLEDRQRLTVASKLLDFYSRRITAKDFSCYELETLLVCNYTRNSGPLSVRRNSSSDAPAPSPCSQEQMLCNLGEILDVLLGDYLAAVKTEDSGEEYLLALIGELGSDKTGSLNDLYVIRQLIEDCLRSK